jgi:cell surface protein SprA
VIRFCACRCGKVALPHLRLFLYLLFIGSLWCALTYTRASGTLSPISFSQVFSPDSTSRDSLFVDSLWKTHIRSLGVDTTDTTMLREAREKFFESDSVQLKLDSLHARLDSLRSSADSTIDIDTTWVVYLDSTARTEQFVHSRSDQPTAAYFVRSPYSLYLGTKSPAYKRELEIDSAGQFVTIRETVNGLDVKVPVTMSMEEYIRYRYEFERQNNWRSFTTPYQFRENRDELGGLLSSFTNIEIPVPANPLFSIFGKNIINLKISGGVDIRFGLRRVKSDQSTGTQQEQVRNEPNFKQDVRINVSGMIGDKLNILADWNTERTFEYENQLKIKYTGYDDEIIQSIEAGNVSLQTPSLVGGGQALFGIKARMQAGPLTLTSLLSQKKGQSKEISITGGKEQSEKRIFPHEYSQTHFFLDTLYRKFWEPLRTIVPQISEEMQINKVIQIEVYRSLSGNESYTNQNKVNAIAYVDLPSHSINQVGYTPGDLSSVRSGLGYSQAGAWIKLEPGKDFKYNLEGFDGHLSILTAYNDQAHAIAVAYKILGSTESRVFGDSIPGSDTLLLKLIKPQDLSNHPDYKPAWDLMLKNIYPLGGRDLKSDGFEFNVVRTYPGQPPVNTLNGQPLITALGLDRFNSQNTGSSDGVFDFIPGLTVDPSRAEIIFPNLQPFEDGLSNFFGGNISDSLLFGDIYDTTQRAASYNTTKNRYEMKVKFSSSATSSYNLGFNVVEGSVQVLYNGTPLVPNVDYTVDYIVGQVVIRKPEALVPGADVQVKYEQNDLFQLASKTLIGARGELALFPKTNIGFTLMNLNQATLSDKVRLGEEPTNNMILGADISSSFDLPFLTDAIDALPFMRTREMSSMRFSGEAAYMLPDPNTKKSTVLSDNGASIAYIDDFEGARRSIPLTVFFSSWTPASPPLYSALGNAPDSVKTWSKARMLWYNRPNSATIREIWPNRSFRTGQDIVQVLDIDYFPSRRGIYNFAPDLNQYLHRLQPDSIKRNWNGIMRYIGTTAGSLLEQNIGYLEIWMRASSADSINLRTGRLYIDLGRISEDAIPDRALNSEDLLKTPSNPTGLPNGILNKQEEDVGLDMMNDADERSKYQTFVQSNITDRDVDPNDPAGDNYTFSTQLDYSHRNGTENNAREGGDASGLFPNTEDLNANYNIDLEDEYIEYEIPLDKTYLTDSTGSVEHTNPYIVGGGSNKWYQYRIPLQEPTRLVGNAASVTSVLQSVQSLRLWLSGFKDSVNIRIAEIGFIGNQWEERIHNDSIMKVTVVNYEDNPNYEIPPGVERERDRTQPDQVIQGNEQSLALQLFGLEQGKSRQVVKRFISRPLDLFNYKSMKMFVHGDAAFSFVSENQYDAEVFIRFGADSSNFYEYRIPVRPGWDPLNEINIVFAELTSIKAARDSLNRFYQVPVQNGPPGAKYGIQGNPSLRQVREISIGIANPSPQGSPTPLVGEIWVNELRLVDVDNEPGLAYRFDTQIKLADFGSFAFNYSKTDPSFHSLVDRFGSQNTGINWSINTSFTLEKFLPQEWQGTTIPFSYSHSENIVKPKYLPNTDVVVEEAAARTGERPVSQGGGPEAADSVIRQSQTLRVQNTYSVPNFRIGIPTQKWYIRDTFNKLSFRFNYNKSNDRDPSIVTRVSWQWNLSVGYSVNIQNDYFLQPFKSLFADIFLLKEFKDWKLYYIPFTNVNAALGGQRSRTFEQARAANSLPRDTRNFGANKSIGFGWKLTEGGLLNVGGDYNLSVDRNLLPQDNDSVGRDFGSILKSILWGGRDRSYRQRVGVNLKPKIPNILDIPKYVSLQSGYTVNYGWQNSFQSGDIGKSAGWDNAINLSVGLQLKALTDPWFVVNEEPKEPPRPAGKRNRDREAEATTDSTKKAVPEEEVPAEKTGSSVNILDRIKTVARYVIKYPFLDYETISISFQQSNRVTNTGVIGSTGFKNFWGRLPFQESRIEDGPSRLYQLGIISDPSGTLQYSPSSSFPFIGWKTIRGARAAKANLTDQFSQANTITLRTNRPLWTGATMNIDWKVGWQFNKSVSLQTDEFGIATPKTVSTAGSIERSYFTLPPVLFFKVFKSSLEEVGKRYDDLQAGGTPSNDAIAESFEKGLETLPFLNKLFGQYVPRPNWSIQWAGVEKIVGISSVVERMSLEHGYTSSFRRDFRGLPTGEEQTDAERITYGFSPLAKIDATFKKFMKGNLTGSLRYNTTTSYDLNLNASSKNIVETLSQEMAITLSFSRRGFSLPLFGLNLSNDIDISFTYSRTKNSKRQHLLELLSLNQEGTPLDGNTRTTIEPRIRYILSTRVSAGLYYRYTRIAPDEGGSYIIGNTTNEAGVDIHITI